MDFDAASVCARMRADLKNPANQLEGGFCMDNLQAVAEEIARLYYENLVPLKIKIAEAQEELISSGNERHYVYWAKKVPGVGNARAVGVRDGSGEVMVAVVTQDAQSPDTALLSQVAAYIEEQRPVGAKPIIVAASKVEITIAGEVSLLAGYDAEEICEAFKQRLNAYFLDIAFSKRNPNLSYHKIGNILFDVEGVSDVLGYVVNGGTDSISGSYDQFFALQEVTLVGA